MLATKARHKQENGTGFRLDPPPKCLLEVFSLPESSCGRSRTRLGESFPRRMSSCAGPRGGGRQIRNHVDLCGEWAAGQAMGLGGRGALAMVGRKNEFQTHGAPTACFNKKLHDIVVQRSQYIS